LIEAIQSGRAIDKILFQKNISGESIGQIRQLAKENEYSIQQVRLKNYSLSLVPITRALLHLLRSWRI
jgi:hypothetical protein